MWVNFFVTYVLNSYSPLRAFTFGSELNFQGVNLNLPTAGRLGRSDLRQESLIILFPSRIKPEISKGNPKNCFRSDAG
jgi:hypothetical protein